MIEDIIKILNDIDKFEDSGRFDFTKFGKEALVLPPERDRGEIGYTDGEHICVVCKVIGAVTTSSPYTNALFSYELTGKTLLTPEDVLGRMASQMLGPKKYKGAFLMFVRERKKTEMCCSSVRTLFHRAEEFWL